jgi:hypothetical protein
MDQTSEHYFRKLISAMGDLAEAIRKLPDRLASELKKAAEEQAKNSGEHEE